MSHDLLESKAIGRLAASRHYPRAARIFTLAAFGLLIAGGFAVSHVPAKLTGTLRNTNLAALVVWSLWWPLVIVGAATLGRVWCQVCPMELVNSLASRIGLKKRAPRFLASGWGVVAFYALALLGFIRTFWAHRFPERMAWFFLFLLASALASGLLFEKRAFCSHLCPVGRILGLYACCSVLEWRVRDASVCETCRSKNCVASPNPAPGSSGGCESNLYPASVKDNRACLLCTRCFEVCPARNLRLSWRRPMADFFSGLRLTPVDLVLLMMVSGLVVWELAEEWSPARRVLEYVPGAINTGLGLSGEAANLVQALVLFVVLPVLLFLLPVLAGKRMVRTSLLESAGAFGLLVLPIAALGHTAKALIRIFSRIPYYPYAFRDPAGYDTALAISAGNVRVDTRIADVLDQPVSWLVALIMAGMLLSVLAIGRKSPVLQSLGYWGRMSHLTFAMLYAGILFVIVILARFG